MALNGSSRTPFDDDLVTNPGTPKDTQPLPSQPGHGAYQARPSRLLPNPLGQASAAPVAPMPNIVTPAAASGGVGSAGPPPPTMPPAPPSNATSGTGSLPNDTSQLSLKRTPISTIIGLSAAGGAVAVLLLAAVVSRMVHRTLAIAHPPSASDSSVVMVPPTPLPLPATGTIGDDGSQDNSAPAAVPVQPTPAARQEATRSTRPTPSAPVGDARVADGTEPDTKAPVEQPADSNQDDRASDSSTANASDSTHAKKSAPDARDAANHESGSQSASQSDDPTAPATPARFTHHRAGYSVAPPSRFKLVQRGQRTIWKGPNGATFLVETTTRPGRTAFGDWIRFDAQLRKQYGVRYRSQGITQTTIAGRPAASWEFELDTKKGTFHKIDVAVHDNGRGYAILGSAPTLKFDAMRPQIEASINSFQLAPGSNSPAKRHHRQDTDNQDEEDTSRDNANRDSANRDQAAAPTASPDAGLAREDLRPDAGY